MLVERHRAGKSYMKFHFGLHRTSRENLGGGLPARCDYTDLRKEIRLVADGMCQILIPEWAAGLQAYRRCKWIACWFGAILSAEWQTRRDTRKRSVCLCYTYSGKETYKRTSLLYLHDSYPLSHEGIVVYSYEGTITPDLTIMMLYLVRTDVVATGTAVLYTSKPAQW